MTVTVLYFAGLRELLRTREERIVLPLGSTVADLAAWLAAREPIVRDQLRTSAWAVNQELAGPAVVLSEGDEVALLPPVSGGAQ